ncbi:hypothetical protein [Marinicella sp. W31]|uniref:hypothetical protein n=1 Tax=Marinicella sp. W31 TaxID=3023713 RepID=UPI00375795A0
MKILLFLIFWSVFAHANDINLDDMPPEIKAAAGLSKLTSEELKVLSDWLNNKNLELRKAQKEETEKDQIGLKAEPPPRDDLVTSTIVAFRNPINRKMIFELENGQQWQQAKAETIALKVNQTNNVVIKPKSFGSWSMYINGKNKGYKVKRIK